MWFQVTQTDMAPTVAWPLDTNVAPGGGPDLRLSVMTIVTDINAGPLNSSRALDQDLTLGHSL